MTDPRWAEPPIWVPLTSSRPRGDDAPRRSRSSRDEAGAAPSPPESADPGETTVIDLLGPDGAAPPGSATGKTADPAVLTTLMASRDDGTTAVWLGQLVRGQFVPLPPAILGLAATCGLAWMGMRNLPGILLLAPMVVLLLAAPGSSHPHDRRLDWLTPAVLLVSQLIYVAAVGFAFGVPAPVTFGLCGLIALRHAELACCGPDGSQLRHRERSEGWRVADTKLGWEGRMLVVGVGAMLGIALVAYVALAAYLVVLICMRVAASCVAAGEGERR